MTLFINTKVWKKKCSQKEQSYIAENIAGLDNAKLHLTKTITKQSGKNIFFLTVWFTIV
jgi:hypothetical protein